MSSQSHERPEELARLLQALSGIDREPAHAELLELREWIRSMSSRQMPPGDGLRLVMDSEDLAQDALLALVRGVHNFRGTTWGEFFAFSKSLIERQKVDLRRHHGREKRNPDAESTQSNGNESLCTESPSFLASGKEDRQKLLDLLEQIPEPKREALRMRLQSLDYDAIADNLHMSPANARQTVSRAIRMLRELW